MPQLHAVHCPGKRVQRPLEKRLVYHLAAEQPGGFYHSPILLRRRNLPTDRLAIGQLSFHSKYSFLVISPTCNSYWRKSHSLVSLAESAHSNPS